MSELWAYFWPPFAGALIIGLIMSTLGYRWKRKRITALGIGVALSLAFAGLWHGPLGAADRLTAHVERHAREALNYYEMSEIGAHLHKGPLTRRLVLTGHADDFQTSELARLMSQLPGVSSASWTEDNPGPPLFAEEMAVALLGFLFGLGLAYLIELHRRYNAQWNW
jgi:hypothetical protein